MSGSYVFLDSGSGDVLLSCSLLAGWTSAIKTSIGSLTSIIVRNVAHCTSYSLSFKSTIAMYELWYVSFNLLFDLGLSFALPSFLQEAQSLSQCKGLPQLRQGRGGVFRERLLAKGYGYVPGAFGAPLLLGALT